MATINSYQTDGGVRWEVRYRTPDHRTTRKRGFPSKRKAQDWASTVEVEKLTGTYIPPAAGKITVGELGPDWLARQKGHMKPSGYRSYDSAWRTHVQPRWGRTPVNAIVNSDVKAWVAELATAPVTGRKTENDEGLSAATVETAHRVLKMILDDAVTDRRLIANPAKGVKLPRRTRKPNVYLTHGQVHALADEVKHPPYRALVFLLCYCGPWWGEAAAIKPRHVDFLRRRISLQENAVTVGSRVVVGSLKGYKHRQVPMPRFVGDELAKVCQGKGRDDLLWANAKGEHLGPPASKDSWLSGAVERCRKADPTFPRVTAHDLRHTAASLAVSAGANVKAVQRMMGHKSAAMTLDVYADLFDDDLDLVADRLEQSVSKMRPIGPPAAESTG
jgi:integrase